MNNNKISGKVNLWYLFVMLTVMILYRPPTAEAFNLTVVDDTGTPVNDYRWLAEEDTTIKVLPGVQQSDSPSINIHGSYAPVVAEGTADSSVTSVDVPPDKRYYVSVLAEGFAMSGAQVDVSQSAVQVIVNKFPLKPAQISVFAFEDTAPLNSAPDLPAERGLAGFSVIVRDFAGQLMLDAQGQPLGTTYDATHAVQSPGSMVVHTDENGEALIKNLAPGKYGITLIPPRGQGWIQTSTIEGTLTVDAWPQSGEPPYFAEWGMQTWHAFFGFVKEVNFPSGGGTGAITGQAVYVHENKPPLSPGLNPGVPVDNALISLSDLTNNDEVVYMGEAETDGSFAISNVPDGQYSLTVFDRDLDAIIDFRTVTIGPATPTVGLGKVAVYRWFGTLSGSIFYDGNENGIRDANEDGIPGLGVNLRFPDGSIYQATGTDRDGEYDFTEVFPFFHWLVAEVDFGRFKATGATFVIDDGGPLVPGEERNPQPQPENGGLGWRTETGVILTEGMLLYAGSHHQIDWGKKAYSVGENGGISGVAVYATTRAEDDPRFAGAEEWEPGIPRVQVALYTDFDQDGVIDDINDDGIITRTDVDNPPFGEPLGPEDLDRNGNFLFDSGDAVNVGYSDSWDDSLPTGCVGDPQVINGNPVIDCAESMATYNQMRPAVFDGGYAFDSYFPEGMGPDAVEVDGLPYGLYIVEASPPPGYLTMAEEHKNVDFGEEYVPAAASLPPVCVGELHTVPDELTLFPGVPSAYAGQDRPLCDLKQVRVTTGLNAAADFHFLTEVPKAGRIWGMALNDVLLESSPNSPQKGTNFGVGWIPVAIRDFNGNEVSRVYTDEWGHYNALVPSFFTNSLPQPSGFSPNMLSACLNDPGPIVPEGGGDPIIDPWYDSRYGQICTNWEFYPGKTTRLDTPILPIAAFAGADARLDCEFPDHMPIIYTVSGPDGGPWVETGEGEDDDAEIEITSVGSKMVANPYHDPADPGSPWQISRDFSFGEVEGSVNLDGVAIPILSWSADTIIARVPEGAQTGQLTVTRGDNNATSVVGITVTVNEEPVVRIGPGQSIQAAVDSASPGTTILIAPGLYKENVILWKKVRLQGWGAYATTILAGPNSPSDLDAWNAKLQGLINNGSIELIPGERPDFFLEEGSGVLVATADGVFEQDQNARIDGLTIMGAIQGGGIFANGYARYLEISNNRLMSNQGSLGGGIRVGTPALLNRASDGFIGSRNNRIDIHNNQVIENGSIDGAGGIGLFKGSNGYRITDNFVCGNFTLLYGGGIAHFGRSNNGRIERNTVSHNQSFDEGGGIFIAGELVPAGAPEGTLTEGAGSVLINANLIQGNLGGDDGGGIRTLLYNGKDVQASPDNEDDWFRLRIYNNMIVNNVSADTGGGISLDDTARVEIIHNTIAHNDSTATGVDAFGGPCVEGVPPGQTCPEGIGGLVTSIPQIAGVAAKAHSQSLRDAFGASTYQGFANPVMLNNILWHNRAFYWDAAYNGDLGGIRPDVENGESPVYWDLGVYATPLPEYLSPYYSILTDDTGYDGSNLAADPLFAESYYNVFDATSKGAGFGNLVTVTYSPLTLAGNYHISDQSPADDLSVLSAPYDTVGLLKRDFDRDRRRPRFDVDAGADEYTGVIPGLSIAQNRVGAGQSDEGLGDDSDDAGSADDDDADSNSKYGDSSDSSSGGCGQF